jgi:hypothetical protein
MTRADLVASYKSMLTVCRRLVEAAGVSAPDGTSAPLGNYQDRAVS